MRSSCRQAAGWPREGADQDLGPATGALSRYSSHRNPGERLHGVHSELLLCHQTHTEPAPTIIALFSITVRLGNSLEVFLLDGLAHTLRSLQIEGD